jgi:hypothetical protein
MKTYNEKETHDHVELLKIVQCFREFIEERRRSESLEKDRSCYYLSLHEARTSDNSFMLSIWELEEDLLNEEEDSKPIRKRR